MGKDKEGPTAFLFVLFFLFSFSQTFFYGNKQRVSKLFFRFKKRWKVCLYLIMPTFSSMEQQDIFFFRIVQGGGKQHPTLITDSEWCIVSIALTLEDVSNIWILYG